MSKQVELTQSDIKRRRFSWRGISLLIAIFLVGTVVNTLSSSSVNYGSNQDVESASKEIIAASIRRQNVNTQANPAQTNGPKCDQRIMVLVDRSHSIRGIPRSLGFPSPYRQNETDLKNAVNSFLGGFGEAAFNRGSVGQAHVHAFAGKSVDHTPYTGTTVTDFYNYISSRNIADATNRFYTAIAVNNIGFRVSGDPNYSSYNYPAGDRGDTNFEDAFQLAGNQIQLLTGGNAAARGDDDFDLVLMVTDGLPSTYNGSTDTIDTDQDIDAFHAAVAVNKLRTGKHFDWANNSDVRPPVPVRGILVGEAFKYANAQDRMNQVFGPGNWSGTDNFGLGLSSLLITEQARLACTNPDKWVEPDIDIQVVSKPPFIEEGKSGTITLRITNTSTIEIPGNVIALWDLNVTQGNSFSNGGTSVGCTPPSILLNIGDYFDCNVTINVPLGAPAPAQSRFYAEGKPWYDANRFFIPDHPYGDTSPVDDSVTAQVEIKRIPLPT